MQVTSSTGSATTETVVCCEEPVVGLSATRSPVVPVGAELLDRRRELLVGRVHEQAGASCGPVLGLSRRSATRAVVAASRARSARSSRRSPCRFGELNCDDVADTRVLAVRLRTPVPRPASPALPRRLGLRRTRSLHGRGPRPRSASRPWSRHHGKRECPDASENAAHTCGDYLCG